MGRRVAAWAIARSECISSATLPLKSAKSRKTIPRRLASGILTTFGEASGNSCRLAAANRRNPIAKTPRLCYTSDGLVCQSGRKQVYVSDQQHQLKVLPPTLQDAGGTCSMKSTRILTTIL